MSSERIWEIATIILNIETELSQKTVEEWEALIALHKEGHSQLPEYQIARGFPASATHTCQQSQAIKSRPTNIAAASCPQSSTSESVEVSVTLEQLKLMYKCYIDNKFCDITIQLSDGHEIRAHRNVLFSGSTVWRKLLTDDDTLSIITVADLERETIQTLLTYVYIGSVPTSPKHTDQLLIAAETYGVGGLKTWCERNLIDKTAVDSAVNLLVLAHRYNAKTLFDRVLAFVRKHTAELKQRDEWKSAFFSYPELAFELFNILL